MHEDPFARFERSRGGLLIPVVVFLVGALVTLVSINLLQRVAMDEYRNALEAREIIETQKQQDADMLNEQDPATVDSAKGEAESILDRASIDAVEPANSNDSGQPSK